MVVTPQHRLLSVTTPLGPDAFLLTAFSGKEEISSGFRYELEMLSDRAGAAARELVGQGISWNVRLPGAEPRWFHGIVSQLVAGPREVRDLRTYRAVVVPQLWYLGQTARCRITEDQNVPEIVEAVFGRLGQTDHSWAIGASYPPRPLCIQYRETDLQFSARLLSEEGIFFFFQHEDGRHTLVLADGALTSEVGPGEEVSYNPAALGVDHVSSWERRFTGPAATGDEAPAELVNGSGRCPRFSPGDSFTLAGHDSAEENGSYLLLAVEHAARDSSFTAQGGGREYANTFTCIPAATPFHPARVSTRPPVRGARLAEVVEPPGGEQNETRRVRVRFSGDGPNRWEDDASSWVRVAGAGDALPAVGQEVLVEFLEGDPDQPVIVGGGAHDSGSPGRGSLADENGNEFRFVSEDGRQEVLLQAGRDCRRVVAHDDTVTVGGDQSLAVSNHRTQTIQNGNETIRLEKGHRSVTLDEGDQTIRLEKGSRTLVVGGDDRQQVRTGNHVLVLDSGHEVLRVQSGNRDIRIEKGDDVLHLHQGKRVVELAVGDDVLTIKTGNQTTRLELGRSITESTQGIELRVGPSRISIEPTGITIEGLVVKVRGHAQTEVNGLMTQVGADGVLEVKGGATVVG